MVKLVDQDEPVLVFTGYILPDDSKKAPDTFQVQLAKNFVVTLPVKIRDFFSVVAVPRHKDDVYIAIANAGGNIADVDRMLETDLIRVVPPGHNDVSLDALSGLKIVPLGYKVKMPNKSESNLVYVGHNEDATSVCPVSPLLASILWDGEEAEDFPASVRRFGVELGLRSDVAIRLALADLDGLLGHGLARWESLVEPQQKRQRRVLEQVSESNGSDLNLFSKLRNFLFAKST